MKQIRAAFILIITAFLLLGNVGMRVFEHLCENELVSVSYFVDQGDPCDAHVEKIVLDQGCCEHEDVCSQSELKLHNDDCCSDQMKLFQLKLDFFDTDVVKQVMLDAMSVAPLFSSVDVIEKESGVVLRNNSPPDKSRGQIILEKQAWLI